MIDHSYYRPNDDPPELVPGHCRNTPDCWAWCCGCRCATCQTERDHRAERKP